jgi:phage/plasmid-associated DNA primase
MAEFKLIALADDCKSTGGVKVATYCLTHIPDNKFTFNVSANKFGDFMDEYCVIAYEDVNLDNGDGIPPKYLYLCEVVGDKNTLPLIGNFKFKFHVEEGEEDCSYFGMDLHLRLIKCYQKAMTDLLAISPHLSEYICCVQRGHPYKKGEFVYINLNLHFPFCQLDINYTKKYFNPYVEKLFRQFKVLESFDTHPVGDWKIFMNNNYELIPLYRSTIEMNIPHNTFEGIYGFVEDEHIEKKEGPELDLKDYFKLKYFSFLYNGKIPEDSIQQIPKEDEDEEEFYKYWLPLFLSIHYWSGQTLPKDIPSDSKIKIHENNNNEINSDNPREMIHFLLPLLNNDRINNECYWLDIGKVLHNIYDGEEEGLNFWISFSSRATCLGRDRGSCEYNYNGKFPRYCTNNLTIKTIAYYAKQDNPEKYNKWHHAWCNKSLNEALQGHHSDVAKAIYRVYMLDYVYSSDSENWYEYRNQRYCNLGKENHSLRRNIKSHFIGIFEKMRSQLDKDITYIYESDDGITYDRNENKIKQITTLIAKLKNDSYLVTTINVLKDYFEIKDFEDKLNKNVYLTVMSNCVLEVVNEDKVIPRPGKPEDFITKFSTLEYPFEYNEDSHWVKEVNHWFDQITCRNKDLKHYMFKRFASFLRGQNNEKLFDVWTGEGDNSKSTVIKTLEYIFGSNMIDFPIKVLEKDSKSNNDNLYQMSDSRIAVVKNYHDSVILESGLIKRFSGTDRMCFIRSLENKRDVTNLTFNKIIMVCNRIPDISNIDKALIRRFVILPFLGTWSHDTHENIEDQFKFRRFKIDKNFEHKIPNLAKGLLWMMVRYYPFYTRERLEFPLVVQDAIEEHWRKNDPYLLFIEEKIEHSYKDIDKKEINTDTNLSMTDLYPVFKEWFKQNYPNRNVPTLPQVKDDLQMSGRLGRQSKRNNWSGIRIKGIITDLITHLRSLRE